MDRFNFHQCRKQNNTYFTLIICALIVGLQECDIRRPLAVVAILQRRLHKRPQAIRYPEPVLVRKAPAGFDNDRKIVRKERNAGHFFPRQCNSFRQFFGVMLRKLSDNNAHKACRLHADIHVFIGEHFIKVLQCHQLLLLCHIR